MLFCFSFILSSKYYYCILILIFFKNLLKIKQIYRLFFSFVTLLIIKLKRFVHTSLHNQVYYSIKLLHAECCLRCRSYVNCAVVPVDMRMQTKTASHAHLSKTTSSHATFKSTYNVIRLQL